MAAGAAHWPTNVLGPCEVTEAPLAFLPGWRPGVFSGLLGMVRGWAQGSRMQLACLFVVSVLSLASREQWARSSNAGLGLGGKPGARQAAEC